MLTAESHRPSSRAMAAARALRLSETVLNLRLDKALRKDVEKAARAQGVKVSEWIRGAMRMRLASENDASR